jgi:hypothetical protein
LNSPREPRGVFSAFEKSCVKSHTAELLVNFEDKLLDDLIKEPIRKIPQIASQSFDEKI